MRQRKSYGHRVSYIASGPPTFVGVHPANRDEYGVSGTEVADIGLGVVSMGFSFSACGAAASFEESADGSCDRFTRQTTDPNPELATSPPGSVQVGSVANGQTNQFLCCIIDEVPNETIGLSTDGNINRNNLESADDNLKSALAEGISWDVYRRTVGGGVPDIP